MSMSRSRWRSQGLQCPKWRISESPHLLFRHLPAKEHFKIDRLLYDGTRGEFDSIADAGRMLEEFEPVIFIKKLMIALATTVNDRITKAQSSWSMIPDSKTSFWPSTTICRWWKAHRGTVIPFGRWRWCCRS